MVELAADAYLPPPSARRQPPGLTALAITVAAVLLAGIVSVAAFATRADAPPSTPTGTVLAFLTNLSKGDVSAALASVDPAERDAIEPYLQPIVDQLGKLGILAGGISLGAVPGIAVTLSLAETDLHAQAVDPSRPDLEAVTFSGGTAKGTVDPAKLLGGLVGGLLGQSLKPLNIAMDLGSNDPASHPIVTVQRPASGAGPAWYVSIGYTVAETARRHAGAPFPSPANRAAATGATSADEAVRGLLRDLTTADFAAAVSLLAPDETAALHDYWPLLAAHAAPGQAGATVDLSGLKLQDTAAQGGTVVTIAGCPVLASPPKPLADLCSGTGPVHLSQLGVFAVSSPDGRTWWLSPYRTVMYDVQQFLQTASLADFAKLLGGSGLGGVLGGPGAAGGLLPGRVNGD